MPTDRPTKEQLAAAEGKRIPDVIAPDLDVLFCGINPGLYSGATGFHFAHPGNRFWKVLHAAGFTDERLVPADQRRLLSYRLGITNLVARTTRSAAELTNDELRRGAAILERKVRRYRPSVVAVVGLGSYRTGFRRPEASRGEQPDGIGAARCWVLPNPSGIQAHYSFDEQVKTFRELRVAAGG